jgi:hypothetical protein
MINKIIILLKKKVISISPVWLFIIPILTCIIGFIIGTLMRE